MVFSLSEPQGGINGRKLRRRLQSCGRLANMRSLALVTISLIGVIALLDVAASFALNGTVDVPPLLVLVVAAAVIVQVAGQREHKVDLGDVVTLHRLRSHAAALARHTVVVRHYCVRS